MTPEEIHQLAVEIYEALNNEGAELGKSFSDTIERTIEEFQYVPFCEVHGCWNEVAVEGWTGEGHIRLMKVCQEHAPLLIGYKKGI